MKAKTKPTQKKITKKKKIVTKSLYPIRKASDVPVTQGMLLETQKMLVNAIKSVNTKIGSMDKKFDSIDFKIESMDKRFDSIDQRFESIDKRFDSIDKRFEAIDQRFDSIDRRFEAIDKRFEAIDKRFDSIDIKFEAIDKRFDSIDKRFEAMDKRFDSIEMKLDSFIEEMRADRHQMKVLMETQEARNKIVLEGYEQLYFRQDRLEVKTEEVNK